MGPGAFHRCHERDRTGEGAEALIGKYQHNIDAKGRLFIPAKFREQLGDVFYVTIGLDGCLSVYSDSKWGDKGSYDLCINTTKRFVKDIVPSIAKFCEDWFNSHG